MSENFVASLLQKLQTRIIYILLFSLIVGLIGFVLLDKMVTYAVFTGIKYDVPNLLNDQIESQKQLATNTDQLGAVAYLQSLDHENSYFKFIPILNKFVVNNISNPRNQVAILQIAGSQDQSSITESKKMAYEVLDNGSTYIGISFQTSDRALAYNFGNALKAVTAENIQKEWNKNKNNIYIADISVVDPYIVEKKPGFLNKIVPFIIALFIATCLSILLPERIKFPAIKKT